MNHPNLEHGSPPPSDPYHPPHIVRRWWIWAAVSMGVFMATLDSSIVNVSLPTIARQLHSDLPSTQWVVMSYMVVTAALLIPVGRLSDLFGRRLVYTLGMLVFTLGSGLCGLSRSITFLIMARALQAVGAAGLMSIGPAIVTEVFVSDRGRALGFLGMVVSLGTITGPSLGGWLVEAFGWPWIFWINLPIGLFAGAYSWCIYRTPAIAKANRPTFDIPGALYSMVILFSLSILLTYGLKFPLWHPLNLTLTALTVVCTGLFIHRERLTPHPMLPFSLFKIQAFIDTSLASYLAFFGLTMIFFLMPFYLENLRHLSPSLTGWILIANAVGLAFTSPISGTLSDRAGSTILRAIGMSISTCGLLWVACFTVATPLPIVIGALWLVGIGNGLFHSPNSSSLLGSVPPTELGVVGAIMAIVRTLGMTTAVALVGLIFKCSGAQLIQPVHFLQAYRLVFLTGAAITLFNVLWIVANRSKLAR